MISMNSAPVIVCISASRAAGQKEAHRSEAATLSSQIIDSFCASPLTLFHAECPGDDRSADDQESEAATAAMEVGRDAYLATSFRSRS
jgi:hypothetical protein